MRIARASGRSEEDGEVWVDGSSWTDDDDPLVDGWEIMFLVVSVARVCRAR